MNTRLLRMIDRRPIPTPNGPWKQSSWLLGGIGQLQPTLIGREGDRGITLRIEGAVAGRCCWHVLPLRIPQHKAFAKAMLAVLEWHKARGTAGPARAAHELGRATGVYR